MDSAPSPPHKQGDDTHAAQPLAEEQRAQAAALAQWWPAYLASVHAAAAAAAAATIGSPHTSRRRAHDKRERSDSPTQPDDSAAAASSSHSAAAAASSAAAVDSSPVSKRSRRDSLQTPLLASPAWTAPRRLVQSPLSSPSQAHSQQLYLNAPAMMPLPAIALPLHQLAVAAADPSSAAALLVPRGFLTAPPNSVTGEIAGVRELGIPVSATAACLDGIATIRHKRVRDFRCHQPAVGADANSEDAPRCAYEATSDRDRFDHLAVHHNRFECFSCDLECGSHAAWAAHLQVHAGSQPASCDFCGRGFKDAKQAKRHSKIHDGDKSFVCPTCSHSFNKSSNLTTHMKLHVEGPKEFACGFEGCDKSFVQKAVRDAHERTHTREKPFLCDVCDASFTQKASLGQNTLEQHNTKERMGSRAHRACVPACVCVSSVVHQRSHTGDRPFACQFCARRFPSTSNLIVHQRVHTGEKAYACTIPGCTRGFTRKQQLERHVMSEHVRKQQQQQMQQQQQQLMQAEQKDSTQQQQQQMTAGQQAQQMAQQQQHQQIDDAYPAGDSLGLPAVLDAAAAAASSSNQSAQPLHQQSQQQQQQSDLLAPQLHPLGSPLTSYRGMYAPLGSPHFSPAHRDLRNTLASPLQRRPSAQAFSFLRTDMQPQNNEQNQNDAEQQ